MSTQDHKHHIASQDDFHTKLFGVSGGSGFGLNTVSVNNGITTQNSSTKSKDKADQCLPEFGGSKSDPKYQTLPYNTKFTVNFVSSVTNKLAPSDKRDPMPTEDSQRNNNDTNESTVKNSNNNNINNMNNNNNNINNPSNQQQLMTVHSTPIPVLSGVSKGLATPLLNQNQQPPHRTDQSMTYQQQSFNKMAPVSTVASQLLGHMAPRQVSSTVVKIYMLSHSFT
jgi:apoptosis-stimulating of p53 protein 1